MKTPDESKRGLRHCAVEESCCDCVYVNECREAQSCSPMLNDVYTYIQQLERRVPRWISVHDALPGMDEKVLFIPACNPGSVYIGKLKYVGEVNAVYFVVNNWRRTVTYSATHWMPLPEPPEEGEA